MRDCANGGRFESNEPFRRTSPRKEPLLPLNLAAEFQELLAARLLGPDENEEKFRDGKELRDEKE
jgi:hypothetical protein